MGKQLERDIANWQNLPKKRRAEVYERAAKKHKWVASLTKQNMDLFHRLRRSERDVARLSAMIEYLSTRVRPGTMDRARALAAAKLHVVDGGKADTG